MEKDTALAVFADLESVTFGWVGDLDGKGYTEVQYRVRLDADTGTDDERTYELFVRINANVPDPADSLGYVLDVAKEHGVGVTLENAGLRLS